MRALALALRAMLGVVGVMQGCMVLTSPETNPMWGVALMVMGTIVVRDTYKAASSW